MKCLPNLWCELFSEILDQVKYRLPCTHKKYINLNFIWCLSTCNGTGWTCTKKECARSCSVYGDSHYNTFDNKWYQFHGACEYILAQDDCNDQQGSFRIQAENVPCGSTGVTCTKSITITLNDTVVRLIRGKKPEIGPLPGITTTVTTADYQMEKSGLFLILHTKIKLTIVWDFGTRIYLTLDPQFKGWFEKTILYGLTAVKEREYIQ